MRECHAKINIVFSPKYVKTFKGTALQKMTTQIIPDNAEIIVKSSLPYMPIDISKDCPETLMQANPATTLITPKQTINKIDLNGLSLNKKSFIFGYFLKRYPKWKNS
jgi:hypothetical protein